MMKRLISATTRSGWSTNDGRKGIVDLADELYGDEDVALLRNRDGFAEFYLDYGLASIAWLDGPDFAPRLPGRKAEGNELRVLYVYR